MYSISKLHLKSMKSAMALALLAIPAGGALAETIVVRAGGPSAGSFPPGKKIADSSVLTLKAGDMLTILDGRGTRTLRGPGTFNTSATAGTASDTRTGLASLLGPQRVRTARTGAVRGGADEGKLPRSPNLWYVDVSQSSTVCIPDIANIQLWRPDLTEAITLTARDEKSGQSAKIPFDKGQFRTSWPTALPVSDGGAYQLSWPGEAKPVEITFSVMNANSEGLESMASMLITRGCDAQLNLLVETVALPDPQPAPEG
ncbi:hypothetical protein [Rhizorhapis sp. SPR117]|uniref:hypothetical protein n=1 Tax=Rhizorhapis sp. SPR117 TaxID=2912611 RepID=UPI001F44BB8A|nr:hypothetical protein [Rhizorhapis sp. SPR117]